jgi:hypothetical protein
MSIETDTHKKPIDGSYMSIETDTHKKLIDGSYMSIETDTHKTRSFHTKFIHVHTKVIHNTRSF